MYTNKFLQFHFVLKKSDLNIDFELSNLLTLLRFFDTYNNRIIEISSAYNYKSLINWVT